MPPTCSATSDCSSRPPNTAAAAVRFSQPAPGGGVWPAWGLINSRRKANQQAYASRSAWAPRRMKSTVAAN